MKIVFVTGCNGQLGQVISSHLKSLDWIVYGMDLSEDSNNQFLRGYIQGSVLSRSDFSSLFLSPMEKINISEVTNVSLINNAGVAVFTPSEERTDAEFDLVSRTNLLGPIYGITEFKRCFIDVLESRECLNCAKSILNIASVYGQISPNSSIYSDTNRNSSEIYGATKAGLIQMTKYFAVRYASHPIMVNCISPGGILNTDLQGPEFIHNYSKLVPMNRLCKPDELGQLCALLTEFSIGYLTGQTISLDGGLTSW
jgi:NAD(P)-dependent dehydrogenase (short-subunit alcohol dehydrogenase family)